MAQENTAATIVKATEQVHIERQGQTIFLNEGSVLYADDTIQTTSSTVEISFEDGAIAILGPHSSIKIKEFSFEDIGPSSFVIEMTQGLMRSITGEVVEQNPDSFKVFTPRATVGIRGTDFVTKINADSSETFAVIAIDQGHNLVVTSHDGQQISLTTAKQGAILHAGKNGFLEPYMFTSQELEILMGETAEISSLDSQNAQSILDEIRTSIQKKQAELADEHDLQEQHGATILEDTHATLEEASTELEEEEEKDSSEENLEEEIHQNNLLLNTEQLTTLESIQPDSFFLTLPEATISNLPNQTLVGNNSGLGTFFPSVDMGTDILSPPSTNQGSTLPGIQVSPSSPFFGDTLSPAPNQTYTLSSQLLNITDDIITNVVISGDMDTVSDGTIQAGHDTITGPNMSAGTVVGDAVTLSNGALLAGNDNITFNNKTGGNSIYGDTRYVTGGEITFAHDTITLNGTFSNSTIGGDAQTINENATVHAWGNDSISVNDVSNANIYGDAQSYTADNNAGGNDTIHVSGTLGIAGHIYGNGGEDSIHVQILDGGLIDGGGDAQQDNVTLGTLSSGTIQNVKNLSIDTLAGAYTVENVESISVRNIAHGGTWHIEGDGEIHNISGGSLYGSAHSDTINITGTFSDGTIHASGGSDSIYIHNTTGGTITQDEGSAHVQFSGTKLHVQGQNISVENLQYGQELIILENVSVLQMQDGNILGNDTDNTISVVTMQNGNIDAGAGNDSIYIEDTSGGSVTNTAGTAQVSFSGNQLHTQGTGITVTSLAEAQRLSVGQDVTLTSMEGGIVQGSDANNTIIIESIADGNIDGGAGADSITIHNASGGTVTNTSGSTYLTYTGSTLHLNGTNITVAELNTDQELTLQQNVHIEQMLGGLVQGTLTENAIHVDTMSGGTLNGGGDSLQDTATINTMESGHIENVKTLVIDTLSGTYTTNNVGSVQVNTIAEGATWNVQGEVFTTDMSGGTIMGSLGDDTVNITGTMSGGTIDGNGDETQDTVNINTLEEGTIKNVENLNITTASGQLTTENVDQANIKTVIEHLSISGTVTVENVVPYIDPDDYYPHHPYCHMEGGTTDDSLTITGDITEFEHVSFSMNEGDDTLTINGTIESYYDIFIDGGIGNDSITLNNSANWYHRHGEIIGGDGNDTITVQNFYEGMITGGNGDDSISVTQGFSRGYIDTGEGNDTVTVDGGEGEIITGAGDDSITITNGYGYGTIDSGEGNDTITADAFEGYLLSGAGDDSVTITNGYGHGTIDTGEGNDTITADAFDGELLTGAGDDSITLTNIGPYHGYGYLNTGDGNDTVIVTDIADGEIITGIGNDSISITGDYGRGNIDTGLGKDTISIKSTEGEINTGLDDDTISITDLGGFLKAGSGNDSITIENFGYNLFPHYDYGEILGEDGDDTIHVQVFNGGNINGGAGDDSITIEDSSDHGYYEYNISGGEGNDTIIINGGNGARISNTSGNLSLTSKADYTYTEGQNITLSELSENQTLTVENKVTISTYTGGYIYGSEADDTFYITVADGIANGTASIIGSQGTNHIYLNWAGGTSHIHFDNLMLGDRLYINNVEVFFDATGTTTERGLTLSYSLDYSTPDYFTYDTATSGSQYADGDTLTSTPANSIIQISGAITVQEYSGDVRLIPNADGTHSMGDDRIMADTMNGGAIYGDAKTVDAGSYLQLGQDIIHVNTLSGGAIYGDVGETIPTSGLAYTRGSDQISISNMQGGEIHAATGRDSISISSMAGGSIYGGTDEDRIHIDGLSQGTIHGDGGNDTITITSIAGSNTYLYGDLGNDSITIESITSLSGGIAGGDGNDTITIESITGLSGNIAGNDGNDTITSTITQDFQGSIDGGEGNDSISLENITGIGGHINGGNGNDIILLTNIGQGFQATVDGGSGDDYLRFSAQEGAYGINIHLGELSAEDEIAIYMGNNSSTILDLPSYAGAQGIYATKFGITFTYTFAPGVDPTIPLVYDVASGSQSPNGDILTAGTFVLEADLIKISGIVTSQEFSGDVFTVSGENYITAGSDTIYVEELAGGAIYGDVKILDFSNERFYAGRDFIHIEKMTGGAVYGDIYETYPATYSSYTRASNDIFVQDMQGGAIYDGGGDAITIKNMNGNDAHIYIDDYFMSMENHTLSIENFTAGTVHNLEDTTIKIGTMNGENATIRLAGDSRTDVSITNFIEGNILCDGIWNNIEAGLTGKNDKAIITAGDQTDVIKLSIAKNGTNETSIKINDFDVTQDSLYLDFNRNGTFEASEQVNITAQDISDGSRTFNTEFVDGSSIIVYFGS